MSFTRNGNLGPQRTIRYRLDGRAGTVPRGSSAEWGYSGRRLVVAGVTSILALWGGLYLVFAVWRADYRQRAEYGVREVLPALDPMGRVTPPGLSAAQWSEAIAATRGMVARLTSSGALDRSQMEVLRSELATTSSRCRPETAVSDLLGLWNDLERRAGPLLADTAYPRLLAPALVAGRLADVVPREVDRVSWTNAVRDTQEMLVIVAASRELTQEQYDSLLQDLARTVLQARRDNAQTQLSQVWNHLSKQVPHTLEPIRRPGLLATSGSAQSDRHARSQ